MQKYCIARAYLIAYTNLYPYLHEELTTQISLDTLLKALNPAGVL
jgi:hypothetical protein